MFYRNCGEAPAEGNTRKFGFINWLDGNSEQLFTNCGPGVGQQSANSWPTVGQQSAHCQPIVGPLSANCWLTVRQQIANSIFWELFLTFTDLIMQIGHCIEFQSWIKAFEHKPFVRAIRGIMGWVVHA